MLEIVIIIFTYFAFHLSTEDNNPHFTDDKNETQRS